MKKLLNVIALSLLVMTPSVSLANFTGKTLKTFKSSADAPKPLIRAGTLVAGVSTPCYAIAEVSDQDLNRLLVVGFFFGDGQGAETTAFQNSEAKRATLWAIQSESQGFDSAAVFAFLQIQLRVIYGCN